MLQLLAESFSLRGSPEAGCMHACHPFGGGCAPTVQYISEFSMKPHHPR